MRANKESHDVCYFSFKNGHGDTDTVTEHASSETGGLKYGDKEAELFI